MTSSSATVAGIRGLEFPLIPFTLLLSAGRTGVSRFVSHTIIAVLPNHETDGALVTVGVHYGAIT